VRSLVAALSHMHHLLHMSQVGEDGCMSLYFVPGRLPEHSFLYDRYIVQSPTGSLPAERCIHEPEESKVEGEEHEHGLLVDMPVLVQSHIRTSPCQCTREQAQNASGDDAAKIMFFCI